jgi:methylglutaconyl-CoA hydratase
MLLVEKDDRGVATLTLNRPEIHNAMNAELIELIRSNLEELNNDDNVRVVVLTGAGRSFSAGADLNWMKASAGYSKERNEAEALNLAEMLHRLNTMEKPTLAVVQGSAFAGGLGLISACDIAITADHALFGITEVRIGLIPATISPYLLQVMGANQARRYFLTAERFDAMKAKELGFVSEVVSSETLELKRDEIIVNLLLGAPKALAHSKQLIRDIDGEVDKALRNETASRIAHLRTTDEGQEGLSSFLEKRKPSWQTGDAS